MDISKLTQEELAQLEEQLEAKKKADSQKRMEDLKVLEELEDEVMKEFFPKAQKLSNSVIHFKREFLDKVEPLIQLKIKLGKAAADQESYTLKRKDNSQKGMIRYNKTIKYDDGIQAAVAYAKQWLEEQVENTKTKQLVGIIDDLLVKDDKGNYSPAKLLLFIKNAEEIGDDLLLKAADAVKKSIYDDMTSISVGFTHKDELGVERKLPLSATKA